MNPSDRCLKRGTIAAFIAFWAGMGSPAFAQITARGGIGRIDWHSGFFPWSSGFAVARVPPLLPPAHAPFPLVLPQVFHTSPWGYATGSGAISMAANGNAYGVIVAPLPVTSLVQLQNRSALPATLDYQYGAVFNIGQQGFPAHILRVSYPLAGTNGPGPGSYVRVSALTQVILYNNASRPQLVFASVVSGSFSQFRLGPFVGRVLGQTVVPRLIGPGMMVLRGSMHFEVAGRQLLLAPRAASSAGSNLPVEGMSSNGLNIQNVCDIVPPVVNNEGDLPVITIDDPCSPPPDTVQEIAYDEATLDAWLEEDGAQPYFEEPVPDPDMCSK